MSIVEGIKTARILLNFTLMFCKIHTRWAKELLLRTISVSVQGTCHILDSRAEESRILRRVKPPRFGEASRKPRAFSRVRSQAIGALAHGFSH